jgi:hypothetical protein
MITYRSQVSVNRPPSDVWPFLVEREKQARWSDVAMQPLTDGPLRAGSRMAIDFGRGPLHLKLTLEMTTVEPAQRMAWRTAGGSSLEWDGAYRLEPAGPTGTTLSQEGTMRFHGFWRLLEPIVGAEIRSGELKELERLKSAIEDSAASPA